MNLTLCKTIQFSVGNLAFLLLCKLCECHHGDMQRSYSCLSLIVNVIDSWIFLNCSFDCSWFSILDVFLSLFSSAIRGNTQVGLSHIKGRGWWSPHGSIFVIISLNKKFVCEYLLKTYVGVF